MPRARPALRRGEHAVAREAGFRSGTLISALTASAAGKTYQTHLNQIPAGCSGAVLACCDPGQQDQRGHQRTLRGSSRCATTAATSAASSSSRPSPSSTICGARCAPDPAGSSAWTTGRVERRPDLYPGTHQPWPGGTTRARPARDPRVSAVAAVGHQVDLADPLKGRVRQVAQRTIGG